MAWVVAKRRGNTFMAIYTADRRRPVSKVLRSWSRRILQCSAETGGLIKSPGKE